VLQDQTLSFYESEGASSPTLVLALQDLRKASSVAFVTIHGRLVDLHQKTNKQHATQLTKMGTHMDTPHCLALTIEYDTYVLWIVDELEYDNWCDALVHSGPAGVACVEKKA
jgi:hypothetical protein